MWRQSGRAHGRAVAPLSGAGSSMLGDPAPGAHQELSDGDLPSGCAAAPSRPPPAFPRGTHISARPPSTPSPHSSAQKVERSSSDPLAAQKWPRSRFFGQVASVLSAPSASQAPWTSLCADWRGQACCSAGRRHSSAQIRVAPLLALVFVSTCAVSCTCWLGPPGGQMVVRGRGSIPRGRAAAGPPL